MRDKSYSCGLLFLLIYKELVFQTQTEISKQEKKILLEKQKKKKKKKKKLSRE